jgi:hypothetical protein
MEDNQIEHHASRIQHRLFVNVLCRGYEGL